MSLLKETSGTIGNGTMQINLIVVGTRMPDWVQCGYQEYARRMPREVKLVLKEIELGRRIKNCDLNRIIKSEGERMLAAIPSFSHVVALEIGGKSWSTDQLSVQLSHWRSNYKNVSLLVGGPDGLATECRSQADQMWSLSKLTFPHAIVRILIAEQLYRACSMLCNHPYHK